MTTARAAADTARPASEAEREAWHRAVESRDPRFDGWILVGVTSTGIYCRPSCPTPVRPRRENTTFHRTPAAAQRAGFRACKRCRPDAVPGSPQWDARGDLVGRAMRLIADGVVDREGVGGLAARLAVSERHLSRVLTDEVGAGPLAIARANRAQVARVLLESTTLSVTEVAFAAGFGSVRQCNDTIREVFAATPSELRRRQRPTAPVDAPAGGVAPITVRLPLRPPYDADGALAWFAARAVEGLEVVTDDAYARVLDLPGGPATVVLRFADDHVRATLRLATVADLATAVARLRALLDLDADPGVVGEVLATDPVLAPLVAARPGLRVPGRAGPVEAAVRAIVGQQVSVAAAARTVASLAAALGQPVGPTASCLEDDPDAPLLAGLSVGFPTAEAFAAADPTRLPMPRTRAAALVAVASQLEDGSLQLDAGADRAAARERLLATPGIGPWTADYVVLRALRDPDVLLDRDLVVRRRAEALGLPADLIAWAAPLRPWRSYVTHHLWAAAAPTTTAPTAGPTAAPTAAPTAVPPKAAA